MQAADHAESCSGQCLIERARLMPFFLAAYTVIVMIPGPGSEIVLRRPCYSNVPSLPDWRLLARYLQDREHPGSAFLTISAPLIMEYLLDEISRVFYWHNL